MKKYHDLADRARSAARTRRQNAAELNELVSRNLPTPAELQVGKVADISDAENQAIAQENKAIPEGAETGCLVNNPTNQTSRLHSLIKSPETQDRIKSGKAHTKRSEARKATMKERVAIPKIRWKVASAEERFHYAGHATEQAKGQTFSLNLSDAVQKKLRRHSNPLRAFTDRVNRELKKQGLSGMPYALALEDSTNEKLHVHGFFVPPEQTLDAVRRAMRAAGGVIPGKASGTQFRPRRMTGGGGWAFYCRKDQERTQRVLRGDARLFLNRAMTQLSREFSLSS